MFFVYIIHSEKFNKFYVGLTSSLTDRLHGHNNGNTRSTRPFIPWRIIDEEVFETKDEARKGEKYLKSAAGRRWRQKNVMGD